MKHFVSTRKWLLTALLLTILPSTVTLAAAIDVAPDKILGSKHDFTGLNKRAGVVAMPTLAFSDYGSPCVYCHIPPDKNQADANAMGSVPGWNRYEPATGAFNLYDSRTLDNKVKTPSPISLLCLSCHDGTIAINSLNNVPGPGGAGTYGTPGGSSLDGAGKLTTASNAYVGTNLQDDHPIGMIYDHLQDGDFVPKTGNPTLYPDKLLYEGTYVECNSCHDPHDDTYGNFLVESNVNSALCGRCHTK